MTNIEEIGDHPQSKLVNAGVSCITSGPIYKPELFPRRGESPKMVNNSPFTELLMIQARLICNAELALALQFIITNAYYSVACNTKVSVRATLK